MTMIHTAAALTVLLALSSAPLSTEAFAPVPPARPLAPSSLAPSSDASKAASFVAGGVKSPFGLVSPPPERAYDRSVLLHMGWGPDPVWATGTVKSNDVACPSGSCVSVTVEVPSETSDGYETAGQYVQVRPAGDEDAKPLFLAIASPPAPKPDEADEAGGGSATGTFEFLIKKTDNNGWICDAHASVKLDVSQAMGSGFPVKENLDGFKYDFPTQNVLLFATGSGIAPVRAAIESGCLGVSPPGSGGRTCRLYYGVRTPQDAPYTEKFEEWEGLGVEVVPVVSRPEESKGGEYAGRTGYIQNALEEDGVPIPRNSGALMCGVKGMTEAVRDALTKAGVFEGRVLTNF